MLKSVRNSTVVHSISHSISFSGVGLGIRKAITIVQKHIKICPTPTYIFLMLTKLILPWMFASSTNCLCFAYYAVGWAAVCRPTIILFRKKNKIIILAYITIAMGRVCFIVHLNILHVHGDDQIVGMGDNEQ